MLGNQSSEVGNQTASGLSSVELHIEELVLHGFPPSDRHRIGDAVERELLRLLTERGVVANTDAAASNVVAPVIRISEPSQPGAVGNQIAASVFSALAGTPAGGATGPTLQ